ncbi:MAG TPA: hypothetical protein VMR34_04980 [Candidatus Saccharimonadales bacterium]|nr:hypothetical protein [Candidatus Saccharimonadales bacterium]
MANNHEGPDSVLESAVLNARRAMVSLRGAEARRVEAHGFLSRLIATQTVHYWEGRVLDTEEHLDMVEQVRLFRVDQSPQTLTGSPGRLFDPLEMSRFGLNPDNELDRQEWLSTTPPHGMPLQRTDYSEDPFEFGSPDSTQ